MSLSRETAGDDMTDAAKYMVRSKNLPAGEARHIRHPLNPNSDIFIQSLSDRVGLQRSVLSLARVPPGKESFLPHAHSVQEEFVFILEGEGTADIGDQSVKVGPGDYLGFPTDGVAHHLRNTGTTDLVYLMGGERTPLDIGRFPTVGKAIVFDMGQGSIQLFDQADARTLSFADFTAKD
jgi:uncharacterized cupin superfamily protein